MGLYVRIYYTVALFTILATPYALNIDHKLTWKRNKFEYYYNITVQVLWLILVTIFTIACIYVLLYLIWNIPIT